MWQYNNDTEQFEWVDLPGSTDSSSTASSWQPPAGATQDANGNYVQTFDDGSTITYGPSGNVVDTTNATDTGTGSGSGAGAGNAGNAGGGSSGILAALNKALNLPAGTLNLANIGTGAAAAAMLAGGDQTKTKIANATIPNYTYVSQGIAPGQAGQGQAYFTPGQYVAPADVATAQATAAKQAAEMTPPKPQEQQLPAANIGTAWSNQGQPVQANTPMTSQAPSTGIAQVASPDQILAMQAQLAAAQQSPTTAIHAAHGGAMHAGIAAMAHGGRYLQGTTDGMADKLDTSIDGVQPAKLSHGEFVIPADVVSHLGNGNSDAGAKKLYQMMDKIRYARTGNKHQGKEINPDKFMPGGIAGYASGGGIKRFAAGSSVTTSPSATSTVTPSTGLGTSTETGLSNWAAPYVTSMLGKQEALSNAPMPVYTGELAAGPSDIQKQYFANANQLASTGLTPTQFKSGTFDTAAVQQYMNPYLQASLNPQLQALQLAAQQGEQGDLSKLTQAGGFGGTRQAVLQGQDAYNLLAQQSNLIGQGYNTAYNNAMNQFNTANAQSLQAQQNQEAANEAAANYGLASNAALGTAGATQQQIKQAQDTASLNQFNQQVQYPQTQLTNMAAMLGNLPISTAATTPNTSTLATINNDLAGLLSLYKTIQGATGTSTGTGTSSGTTGSGNGTTNAGT